MGQKTSKNEESDRLSEVFFRCLQNSRLLLGLIHSNQAVRDAIVHHGQELIEEQNAILARMDAIRKGTPPPPMPDPTPPLRLPPLLPEEAATAALLYPAACVEPGTPMGGSSEHRGQRGGTSSSEEGGHGGDAERNEGVPLLAAWTARQALGLRRQQLHAEEG